MGVWNWIDRKLFKRRRSFPLSKKSFIYEVRVLVSRHPTSRVDEVYQWCEANIRYRYHGTANWGAELPESEKASFQPYFSWWFQDPADAMLFKLYWG